MSRVTNIILITHIGEDEYDPTGGYRELDPIQAYLSSNHYGRQLERVERHAGGDKHFGGEVWMAAINHLNEEKFLEVFEATVFENPDSVQLLLKGEDDERFRLFQLCD